MTLTGVSIYTTSDGELCLVFAPRGEQLLAGTGLSGGIFSTSPIGIRWPI
jgi:hypothetical protein